MCFSQIHTFWNGWRDISRFSWPIDLKFGGDLHRMYLYRVNYRFQNLMFFPIFFFFFYHQKRQKAQGKSMFKFQNAAIFNFWNFAVSVVHELAIFILIKMHFGSLVSNNQGLNHVSHSNPFLKTCFTQGYIISTTFINFVKKKLYVLFKYE